MTQIAANHPAPAATALQDTEWDARLARIAADKRMSKDNTTLEPGALGGVMKMFLGVGVLGLIVTLIGGFAINPYHALAAYEVGVFTALAMALGGLFFVMVFHSLNAGWSITLRRQFENVAWMVRWVWVMMIPIVLIEILTKGMLFDWLDPSKVAESHLLQVKEPYLNATFFGVRFLIYGLVWITLSTKLIGWSMKADETGDRSLGRKARFWSGFGIPCFALTTAFASFDFLMSLDYRFFSTMWGVMYFASAALVSTAVVTLIASRLLARGKLVGLVHEEHFHDLGKLMFTFTVFWGYIGFSQYFLIWYSNIPEETAWYLFRQQNGWQWLFVVMTIGHFVVPFLMLVWRKTKRSPKLLSMVAIYVIIITAFDMVWIIRPMAYLNAGPDAVDPGFASWNVFLDIAGVVGVLGIFGAILTWKIGRSNLLPIKDPMLHEAMSHKNYV
ncbi:MAG: hypothetical protein JKY96_02655 [Phycisphaerales bacterium]|nr:hypothetical protein [Phycisphaerales bacterium]